MIPMYYSLLRAGVPARYSRGVLQSQGLHAVHVPPNAHARGNKAAVLATVRWEIQAAFLRIPQDTRGAERVHCLSNMLLFISKGRDGGSFPHIRRIITRSNRVLV